MNKTVPIFEVDIPEYKLDNSFDYKKVGAKIDRIIKDNFKGKHICIRAIGSIDHPNLSTDQLIEIIIETGTDKYDQTKKPFWHDLEVYKDKGIEIFACLEKIEEDFDPYSTY